MTEFAVRFPSALAGIASVYLIYLIVFELFKDKKLSLISAFVASITPWLIYFSRGAWEVNVALALTLTGIYFFLKSLQNPKFLTFASASFALTLVAYQGAKLSTGIVVLILLVTYWKDFWKIDRKSLRLSLVVGILVSLPIIFSLFQGKAGRLSVFSVFSYRRPEAYLQAFLDQGNEKVGSVSYYFSHSESVNFLRGILGRYFNHFSGRFLFFEGDWGNPRHSAPNSGVLLLSDLVVLLFGLTIALRNKIKKEHLFVFLWLLASPLPAVLSRDQIHAVRALNMVIPLIIIISYGYAKISKWFYVFTALAFIYFLDSYFVHVPKHDSKYWEYGYKQIVETVTPIMGNYKKVKVQQSFAQPYIYFLFFQKYDPVNGP
ncbi:MAG: hypothetical protein UX13_C0021G0011 [Candidatus Woesebacteria bacterium GW2011_GWB1_45_5]|uniref:Glycosyltransferase RgtA/B/C/D-like domain-containing protein n=1 Tax=Candidatus Woesebacteria bacterium GW2011_GWB1_45_5 TaxID=1618581 RepID=A0A0G1MP06_9BACT|nr:MAG: hypothetical protein UX13_C0021G0011 [Candidatus Woesebacteria bacterium GW2011_GWB1_45_5]